MFVATPAAGTPSPALSRTQREDSLPNLVAHAVRHSELPRGIRFQFAPTAERLRQIADVVPRERGRCSGLEFKVGLEIGAASLTLDVTGPATKGCLDALVAMPAAA